MVQKTVKKSRRKYDADFKRELLSMVESGRSIPEVAEALGIGNNLVYAWMRQAGKEMVKEKNEPGHVFDDEKFALQKRIRDLEMERDILKKALGIFSRPM
ncbi:MAG: transposase [Flavisolibacter sp.]